MSTSSSNAALDHAVAAPNAVVAVYADTGGGTLTVPVRELMFANLRWQGVVVYTVPEVAKAYAVADVAAAVADGALRAGEEAGLPLHRFPLAQTQDAHAAVQNNAVGKVMRGDRSQSSWSFRSPRLTTAPCRTVSNCCESTQGSITTSPNGGRI